MTMLFRTVRQGSEEARIWQICDELTETSGSPPSERDVVSIYVSEGGEARKGVLHYSAWKAAYLNHIRTPAGDNPGAPELPKDVGARSITISDEGHLVLPIDVRQAMMLDDTGRVTVSVVDGELRIMSPLAALRRLQQRVRPLHHAKTLVSDDLIAERRAEAADT
jgi:bifunctional DNA-binding transcriptional regulator/antitoxin component of YhaV-PrlF toxin-antitoxin module